MPLDRFINSVRAEVAKRFNLKTNAEIDAFFIGLEESAKDNQESLEKRDKMLRDTVAELCKAKRLLKAAVEDFKVIGKVLDADCDILINCEECPLQSGHYNCRSWNHQDEALALIGKDIDVPASADDTNVGGKIDSWISCEDRLPGENTLVLCYARSTTGEGNQYFIGAIAHGEFWFLKVYDIGRVSHPVHYWEVTHWQPLPKPPKDGDTE